MEDVIILFSGIVLGICLKTTYTIFSTSSANIGAVRIADLFCLQLLSVSLEEALYIKRAKHKIMRKFKTHPPEHVKMLEEQDNKNINRWKKEAVDRLISRHPDSYRVLNRYYDWDSAMHWLDKEMKKNI